MRDHLWNNGVYFPKGRNKNISGALVQMLSEGLSWPDGVPTRAEDEKFTAMSAEKKAQASSENQGTRDGHCRPNLRREKLPSIFTAGLLRTN